MMKQKRMESLLKTGLACLVIGLVLNAIRSYFAKMADYVEGAFAIAWFLLALSWILVPAGLIMTIVGIVKQKRTSTAPPSLSSPSNTSIGCGIVATVLLLVMTLPAMLNMTTDREGAWMTIIIMTFYFGPIWLVLTIVQLVTWRKEQKRIKASQIPQIEGKIGTTQVVMLNLTLFAMEIIIWFVFGMVYG